MEKGEHGGDEASNGRAFPQRWMEGLSHFRNSSLIMKDSATFAAREQVFKVYFSTFCYRPDTPKSGLENATGQNLNKTPEEGSDDIFSHSPPTRLVTVAALLSRYSPSAHPLLRSLSLVPALAHYPPYCAKVVITTIFRNALFKALHSFIYRL